MRVSVIGSGYVGLVTGMGFVKLGNEVVFVDVDDKKINMINNAQPPIYEEGLEELMKEFKGKYYATKDYREALFNSDVTFIAVGTPSREDGSIDLKYVKEASKAIGKALREKNDYYVIVVKSTVLPGTTEEVVKPILEEYSGKKAFKDFGLAMNPEFLREGVALKDFLNPDRIVIGVQDEKTKKILEELYAPINAPKLFTDIKTAEMIKYASNTFLATYAKYNTAVLGVERVEGTEVEKYIIIKPRVLERGIYEVLNLVKKPGIEQAPSDVAIVGRYILIPGIFDCLRNVKPDSGGEIQLTDALNLLLENGEKILARKIEGKKYDIGTPEGWLRANIGLGGEGL